MQWRFTPGELLLLWPQLRVARLPFPIQLRDAAATVNERDAVARQARQQLEHGGVLRRGRIDADVEYALRTLTKPLVWCTAFGFYGPQPQELIRVRAAHAGGAGVLAVQLAGRAEDVGGDLVLSTTTDLPAAVVGALPSAPAGREQAATWQRPAPRSSGFAPVNVVHTRGQRSAERFRRLVEGPFSCAGQLTVTALGPDDEPRKLNALRWFDRPGDGRYLTLHGQTSTVCPADAATLVRALQEQLTATPREFA